MFGQGLNPRYPRILVDPADKPRAAMMEFRVEGIDNGSDAIDAGLMPIHQGCAV
jgi:hypothetical protein